MSETVVMRIAPPEETAPYYRTGELRWFMGVLEVKFSNGYREYWEPVPEVAEDGHSPE